jgi:hypothetical protein
LTGLQVRFRNILTAQALEILEELDKLKLVPWEAIEKFDSLEEQSAQ